jgi:hypothetical protein
MIFPNHPAFEELRPGMGLGYQPGAHAMLGYQPGAHAMLGYHAGSHGNLGTVSDAQMQAAWDAGLDGNTIDALSAAGATDADIQALMAGTTDVPTLMAKYAGLQTTEGTSVTATTSHTTPSPTPTNPAQSPPGSTLLYTVSYNPVKVFSAASSVILQIAALLPSHGMAMATNAVQQSGLTSQASFTMTILDSVGHQYLSDAQSVLDGLLNQFTNNGKLTSSVTLVSAGTTASGAPGGAPNPNPNPNDALAWLENNALYIGGWVAVLVVLNNLVGGKRR